jgi:hypothetical protein
METEIATFNEQLKASEDFLNINGTDYIELYVDNAKQQLIFIKRHCVLRTSLHLMIKTYQQNTRHR